jgi:sugar phosphate isomerase/epimerase
VKPCLPFRLGSTSYVYPADILPNVRRLAPLVDDVELVLFEVDDQSNLPSPDVVKALGRLAEAHDLTFTVHLPLDLRLASDDAWRHPSMEKACRVIRSTRPLRPWAYVVHLDGTEIENGRSVSPAKLAQWRDRAARSLEMIAQEAGTPHLLAVENLENYHPDAFLPLLDRLPISLCADVGHFLKVEEPPLPYLRTHGERVRVIHLHGSRDGRDHRGLDLIPDDLLAGLRDWLLTACYRGVLTLEVFTKRHFFPGRARILSLMQGEEKERI